LTVFSWLEVLVVRNMSSVRPRQIDHGFACIETESLGR
jgi:hypothetical protein